MSINIKYVGAPKNSCLDSFVKEGLVRCKARWNCPKQTPTHLCFERGNLDADTKLEYLINSANQDLDDENYISAGKKYKLASKLSKPLTAEQVANLLSFAYKSMEDNRIKDFVIQVGMSGGDHKKFLHDIKDISKETAIKTNANGTWIKRYEIAHEWLDKYFKEEE